MNSQSLSLAERQLWRRVFLSDGGCFQPVDEPVAQSLIAKGVLDGGPVDGFPGFWRLRLAR
jgi:hypothetical protein